MGEQTRLGKRESWRKYQMTPPIFVSAFEQNAEGVEQSIYLILFPKVFLPQYR